MKRNDIKLFFALVSLLLFMSAVLASAYVPPKGDTTCSTDCPGCGEISVTGCQYCGAVSGQYVRCYDSNDNIIDEEWCMPCS